MIDLLACFSVASSSLRSFLGSDNRILNRTDIIEYFGSQHSSGLIAPFTLYQVKSGLSYGLGSFGYDLRLSPDSFYIFAPSDSDVCINPKAMSKSDLKKITPETDDFGCYFIIPPHTYALGVVEEYIAMPDNITGICLGKSTYARAGIIVNMTPVEAGWTGYLTIEISNSCSLPCRVYANEGIAQILFFRGEPPSFTYVGRKYQDQPKEVVVSRVV